VVNHVLEKSRVDVVALTFERVRRRTEHSTTRRFGRRAHGLPNPFADHRPV